MAFPARVPGFLLTNLVLLAAAPGLVPAPAAGAPDLDCILLPLVAPGIPQRSCPLEFLASDPLGLGVAPPALGPAPPLIVDRAGLVDHGLLLNMGPGSGYTGGDGSPFALRFDGVDDHIVTLLEQPNPGAVSVSAWFATTTPRGKLVGFESQQTGVSAHYDRHLYIDAAGRVRWGNAVPGASPSLFTLTSPSALTDGAWHHAVGTIGTPGSAEGMKLYVDGLLVGSAPWNGAAGWYTGYWRVGAGNLNYWPDGLSNTPFAGLLAQVKVDVGALGPAEVASRFAAGPNP